MIVGVVKETMPGERRVAITPDSVRPLQRVGLSVMIEGGAGVAAGYPDSAYAEAGAEVTASRGAVFDRAAIVAQVNTFAADEALAPEALRELGTNKVVLGLANPLSAPERVAEMARAGVTAFGLELIPRITRAQSMDVLSSMAMLAGYKAMLLAADNLPRCFPMFMTAAGTLKAAKVFVIGAGVAGLQAIATAKRLGAVVSGYDVRPEVAEQVKSVGGKFVDIELDTGGASGEGGYARPQGEEFYRRQRELMARVVGDSDVVVTTAAIPGRKAPVLVTDEMLATMRPGSVIVDLAAERGGNCEATQAGVEVERHGVTVLGPVNLPSQLPFHASQMFSRNVATFLAHLVKEGQLVIDTSDEITLGTLMCRDGQVVHSRLRQSLGLEESAA